MITREEMAYRRGMHQAFAQAYAWSVGIRDHARLSDTLGRAEDAAQLLRESREIRLDALAFVRDQIAGGNYPPLASEA